MPRMTICRSSLSLAALGALAIGVAPVAMAQDPARPATHTVQRGDTLWDLAARYLGDPFLWPQIYRLNTDVVADPHWIYPGEVLRLGGADEVRAVPDEAQRPQERAGQPAGMPAQQEWQEGESLFPRRRAVDASAALEAYRDRTYRPLRAGEFHSSGFLTEGDDLPFGTLLGNTVPSQIEAVSQRSFPLLGGQVAVRPPEGATYAVGDSLLVVELLPGPSGQQREWGHIARPTGILVVSAVNGDRVVATVRSSFHEMRDGQLVLPVERFVPGGETRAQPVANGVSGRVIMSLEEHPMRHPLDVVFLDVGRAAGVSPGDIFEVRRGIEPTSDDPTGNEVMATMQVVHVRDRSATAKLLTVTSPDFPTRAPVRQVARLQN